MTYRYNLAQRHFFLKQTKALEMSTALAALFGFTLIFFLGILLRYS